VQLIEDGDKNKAKEILDLSIEKMPIDYFGFYSLLEPYISTYFRLNEIKKGNDLFEVLAKKYKQNLHYYSKLPKSKTSNFSIYTYAENIITDTERYRGLIESVTKSNDDIFIGQAIEDYIESTAFAKELYGNYEYYTLLTPFVENIYKSGNSNFSKDLYLKISSELKSRLIIFSEMPSEQKTMYVENIAENLFQYTKIINIMKDYEIDETFIKNEIEIFMEIKETLTN
jgi:hypothetical protein